MYRFAVIIFLTFLSQNGFSQKNEKVRELINKSFYRITSEDSAGFSNALSSSIIGKTIVGLGEATHGTREFRQGFVKLVKDLVRHNGFNVVLLAECGFSDTFYLNEYVVYGRGCPLKFNKNQSVVDEDFKELAEWLRKYNNQRNESDRVWMLGADILFLNSIALDVLTLSDELGVKLSESQLAMLSEFAFIEDQYKADYFQHRVLEKLILTADSIVRLVTLSAEKNELNFHQKRLLQSVSNLRPGIRFSDLRSKYNTPRFGNAYNIRDSSIFRNIQWIKALKQDAKIVMFAHNGHIEKDYGNTSLKMSVRLGHLLRNTYGQAYLAIATEVGRGEFFYHGKISERKDRIGNILYGAGLGEGLLLFENEKQLDTYFVGKLSITNGNSGPATGNFSSINNASKAFDGFYYFPESTLSTPLASRNRFEDFIFNLPVGDDYARRFRTDRVIKLKITSTSEIENNSCHGQSTSLSILFLTKKNRFADFASVRLTAGEIGEYAFQIPKDAKSAQIAIAGRGIRSVYISNFEIDGVIVGTEEGTLSAKDFYLKNLGGEITIERKSVR